MKENRENNAYNKCLLPTQGSKEKSKTKQKQLDFHTQHEFISELETNCFLNKTKKEIRSRIF